MSLIPNVYAFVELQKKLLENTKQLKQVESSIILDSRQKKRSEITLQEIAGFPEDTKLYTPVGIALSIHICPYWQWTGKMFLRTERSEVYESLKNEAATMEKELAALMV